MDLLSWCRCTVVFLSVWQVNGGKCTLCCGRTERRWERKKTRRDNRKKRLSGECWLWSEANTNTDTHPHLLAKLPWTYVNNMTTKCVNTDDLLALASSSLARLRWCVAELKRAKLELATWLFGAIKLTVKLTRITHTNTEDRLIMNIVRWQLPLCFCEHNKLVSLS